jgi:hypothetical protein
LRVCHFDTASCMNSFPHAPSRGDQAARPKCARPFIGSLRAACRVVLVAVTALSFQLRLLLPAHRYPPARAWLSGACRGQHPKPELLASSRLVPVNTVGGLRRRTPVDSQRAFRVPRLAILAVSGRRAIRCPGSPTGSSEYVTRLLPETASSADGCRSSSRCLPGSLPGRPCRACGRIGQHPVITSPARPDQHAGDPARIVHSHQPASGRATMAATMPHGDRVRMRCRAGTPRNG